MADVIKSYLVSLGFKVDEPSLRRFETVLDEASKAAVESTSGIAKEILKWQVAITGAFAAVSAGVIAVISSVAEADEQYRIFGQRMLLTKDTAEATKRTLDAMHATMADMPMIAADPERAKRFKDIFDSIQESIRQRPADYNQTMIQWRALNTEFTKAGERLEDLKKRFASDMIRRLGPDIEAVHKKFEEWLSYLELHMPEISDWFVRVLVPILKDTWEIVKAIGTAIKELTILFINMFAAFTGDDSLRTKTMDWEKLAIVIERIAGGLTKITTFFAGSVGESARFASNMLDPAFLKSGGEAVGVLLNNFGRTQKGPSGSAIGGAPAAAGGAQDAASRAARLAAQVGMKTGVDPRLIFEQWAFETGGFTSGAFNNLNNVGGFKVPGTNILQKFGSIEESADYYAQQIGRNYPGLRGAHTEADFGAALKNGRIGSYFGKDDPNVYMSGMAAMGRRFEGTIANNLTINVAKTDASALDISQAVDQVMQKNNLWVLSQLQQGSH